MLPSTSPREVILACPFSNPWNLSSFTVEYTISFPCSRSDPSVSRQGAALAHLDSIPSYNLVFWTVDSVPFPFSKGGGVLANCSLCGTEATLSAHEVHTNHSDLSCLIKREISLISLKAYPCTLR